MGYHAQQIFYDYELSYIFLALSPEKALLALYVFEGYVSTNIFWNNK